MVFVKKTETNTEEERIEKKLQRWLGKSGRAKEKQRQATGEMMKDGQPAEDGVMGRVRTTNGEW